MRTTAELDLLEQIYTEMQELKRRMENNQERRIGRQEFAHMLNIEPETLGARIREGRYQKPLDILPDLKDGDSYCQMAMSCHETDTIVLCFLFQCSPTFRIAKSARITMGKTVFFRVVSVC